MLDKRAGRSSRFLGVDLCIKKIVVFLLRTALAGTRCAKDDFSAGDAAVLDLVFEDIVLAVELGQSWPESVTLLLCLFKAWG